MKKNLNLYTYYISSSDSWNFMHSVEFVFWTPLALLKKLPWIFQCSYIFHSDASLNLVHTSTRVFFYMKLLSFLAFIPFYLFRELIPLFTLFMYKKMNYLLKKKKIEREVKNAQEIRHYSRCHRSHTIQWKSYICASGNVKKNVHVSRKKASLFYSAKLVNTPLGAPCA